MGGSVSRLDELAAVAYEAFSRACGSVDPANGCRLALFSQLPARAQGGWRDGVRAVLEDVYREQEAARAASAVSGPEPAAAIAARTQVPVESDADVSPAGRAGTRKPRK